jgi:DNA-directed RNA polymerase subunit RPC12/RpoP
MIKQKTTWLFINDDVEEEYQSKEEAEKAEEEYNSKQKVKRLTTIFQKYFRTYHKDNEFQKYIYLCVDCGKKLQEYDVESDGHRNSVGKILYKEKDTSYFLGGQRCKECDKKAKDLLNKMENVYSQNGRFRLSAPSEIWFVPWATIKKENGYAFLTVLEIVEYYDKNFEKDKK